MKEEKRHAMFASFRAGRSPKEVIEFFNYPKSTVYDQWKAWNSFKKNDAHRKKRSRSLGATRTDEFVAEVKRTVNEDGNKSYAKLAAEMGCQADHHQHHQQGPGLHFVQVAHKSRETQAWLLENLPYHWSPDLAAIVEEFVNMKKASSPRPAAASGTTSRWSSQLMGAY
ncbi:Uncharacterized protein FKW44_019657 [Caligus rogercresseyi]|uniref:Uncharacterized protein n=1 Tax=Caligus rogercresseyi TaxID=217165 RepID=A0A7T8JYK2_CALRO|nr:Uncharacterized protein FKW44_019657 [Caligus rogercresseyi]